MGFNLRRLAAKMRRRLYAGRRATKAVSCLVVSLLLFAFLFGGFRLIFSEGSFDHSLARSLLLKGMPFGGEYEDYGAQGLDLRSLIYALTNYDLYDPVHIVAVTLPFYAQSTSQIRAWEERPFVFIPELSFAPDPIRPPAVEQGKEQEKGPLPQVLIYHTHTSEMYLGRSLPASRSQEAHYHFRNSLDPTITGVMAVGRHLSNALGQLGLATLHETRIHTLPSISYSYGNSEKTVREIVARCPHLQMVIDLHRDAGVPNPTTVINGCKVARLLLVVGTAEKVPLVHPDYKENLAFAQQIKNVCDEMYPNLMRPIQVKEDARYNQHLHPKSVIIEVGSVENTLDEALLAAELLANVLARVL